MLQKSSLIFLCSLLLIVIGCTKEDLESTEDINVIFDGVPYPTEDYYRIGYTLKIWEFEKDGLELFSITVHNSANDDLLYSLGKDDFITMVKGPLAPSSIFEQAQLTHYYFSFQLTIPKDNPKPSQIYHTLHLWDKNKEEFLTKDGGLYSPRWEEEPIAIASPLKGKNYVFANLSTNGYHFGLTFHPATGQICNGERYAFDLIQLDGNQDNFFDCNKGARENDAHYCYGDTLFAVGDGEIVGVYDGYPENSGDAMDKLPTTLETIGGNYVWLKLSDQVFAFYAHCIPYKIMVNEGDIVKEGDPIALLGNSGNSTGPHLHFQLCDRTDALFSIGIPFVFKTYERVGVWSLDFGPYTPDKSGSVYRNCLMENGTVVNLE